MSTKPHHDDLAKVLGAVLKIQPDKKRAEYFIETQPIAAFGGRTLLQMVAQGRAAAAISYIESTAAGFVG